MSVDNNLQRVFKTAWFSKAARKAHIPDTELCEAVRQVMQGQADDLGGVFKKRVHGNTHRSIILAKAGRYWVYETALFAKQNKANIEDDELVSFRALAKAYAGLTALQVEQLLRDKDWMGICHG